VLFGEVTAIELEASGDATYNDGNGMVSAFQRDQTLVRAILRHDIALRHDVGMAVKTGVTWGS
jgi:hypothetical protein